MWLGPGLAGAPNDPPAPGVAKECPDRRVPPSPALPEGSQCLPGREIWRVLSTGSEVGSRARGQHVLRGGGVRDFLAVCLWFSGLWGGERQRWPRGDC